MLNDLSNIDINSLKYELLSNGKYDLYKLNQLACYFAYLVFNEPSEHVISMYYDLLPYLNCDMSNFSNIELDICGRIYSSHNKKIYRLKCRINSMFKKSNCLFITFTFRDSVLKNTCSNTRRDYVQRCLKNSGALEYVANIDFGADDKFTNREHYHAILCLNKFDMSTWRYGYSFVERVNSNSKSCSCISKYINKLTYHAYKESTKCLSRLLYSRKFNDGVSYGDQYILKNI